MRDKIYIADKEFKTKKDLKIFVDNLISSFEIGIPISCDNPHFEFLFCLTKRHPDAGKKIGPGIQYYKMLLDDFRQKRLYLYRNDGSFDDISYNICITSNPRTDKSKEMELCRDLIHEQIQEFKKSFSEYVCNMCKLKIESKREAHADHIYPFYKIVSEFKSEKNCSKCINSP